MPEDIVLSNWRKYRLLVYISNCRPSKRHTAVAALENILLLLDKLVADRGPINHRLAKIVNTFAYASLIA